MALPTRILALAGGSFPSRVMPVHGVFVKERLRHVSQLPDTEIRVLAPSPYFPPVKYFKRWYPWSQIPQNEVIDGLQIERPKYILPPKIGGYIHAGLIHGVIQRTLRSTLAQYKFDLIDAHFVYPNGVAATRLGLSTGKPVVITGRGEDILQFPKLPLIGRQIRWALRNASELIALSDEIADAMIRNGACPKKITTIPNGVDCEKFDPIPPTIARRELEIPEKRTVVVTAGYRIERKGFHILVDAIPQLKERFPDILLVIVGGEARWEPDFLPTIQERIRRNDVAQHVVLTDTRPQEELKTWFSAADIFALMTSREGSPNVLMEALACGLPAVATAVGGIPEVLADSKLGILLPDRSANAAAAGITEALSRQWDRHAIRQWALQRSWQKTAEQVHEVFQRAIADHAKSPRRIK